VSHAALQRLTEAQSALVAAIDAGDVAAIEDANVMIREAVNVAHATGTWKARADLRADILDALNQADAARGRLNTLLDQNRRRLDRLAALAGSPHTPAYRRDGRIG
jgi:hypothetical protein